MPRVRDISFVRKLCSLGFPAETVAQCVLPELRKLIPSHSAGVFWVDKNGEMTNLYAERLLPPDAMAAYYDKHYLVKARGFTDAFRRRAESADSISFHSFSPAEQSTDYFRDVMQRLDAYHVLYGIIKQGTRSLAQISFYRGQADCSFDRQDADALRSVIRYLAVGLEPVSSTPQPDDITPTREEELGIVTSTGVIVAAPEAWYRLLRLAALAKLSPRHALREQEAIELLVQRVCRNVQKQRAKQSARELTHETSWGRFVIRAFDLSDPERRITDQIGLLIRREEPRALSLVRGTGAAALSPQQREVALLIAGGKTNREIAGELGLSFNTASHHVKQVYMRLEVKERSGVAKRLLDLAQSTVAY
jgi:DNA-binding CsgD family transcriptional regulator